MAWAHCLSPISFFPCLVILIYSLITVKCYDVSLAVSSFFFYYNILETSHLLAWLYSTLCCAPVRVFCDYWCCKCESLDKWLWPWPQFPSSPISPRSGKGTLNTPNKKNKIPPPPPSCLNFYGRAYSFKHLSPKRPCGGVLSSVCVTWHVCLENSIILFLCGSVYMCVCCSSQWLLGIQLNIGQNVCHTCATVLLVYGHVVWVTLRLFLKCFVYCKDFLCFHVTNGRVKVCAFQCVGLLHYAYINVYEIMNVWAVEIMCGCHTYMCISSSDAFVIIPCFLCSTYPLRVRGPGLFFFSVLVVFFSPRKKRIGPTARTITCVQRVVRGD